MTWGRRRRAGGVLAVAAALAVTACGGLDPRASAEGDRTFDRALVPTTEAPVAAADPAVTVAPTTTAPPAPTTSAPPPPPTEPSTTTLPHPERVVVAQAWVPFSTVGPVVLHHPSDHTEAVGFHQSGHDGAQHQAATATAVRWFTMEDRGRDTDPHGAADIVVEPDRPLRVPVTGTVVRSGRYTLYCDNVDEYAVIEPDARPGWEVKVLHVEGLAVVTGQRVEAGVTPLAARSRVLPFPSQVEDSTGLPAWPHVHIEVVDPSVPDRPTGGGCP